MVKHIVTFKFKGSAQERIEVSKKFKEALLQLPEKIEVLKSMEVGINENHNETWDLVLTACVDKLEDVAVYSNHPAHIQAASIISSVKDLRACVDYTVS